MSANIPDLPRVKPGEVITAEKWNLLCDAIEALRVWTVSKDEPYRGWSETVEQPR